MRKNVVQLPFELPVQIPVQLLLELELNWLTQNVIELEFELSRMKMKQSFVFFFRNCALNLCNFYSFSNYWVVLNSRFGCIPPLKTIITQIANLRDWERREGIEKTGINSTHCNIFLLNIKLFYNTRNRFTTYSRVQNKRSPRIINLLTFFQGLRPYSRLHRAYFSSISIKYKAVLV